MANSLYYPTLALLEERASDPADIEVPAGKWALYRKTDGKLYQKDGDSKTVTALYDPAYPLVYLGSGQSGDDVAQWDISLPSGYQWLRLRLSGRIKSNTVRNWRFRVNNISVSNSYTYFRRRSNNTFAGGLATYIEPVISGLAPDNVDDIAPILVLDIWDYDGASTYTQFYWQAYGEAPLYIQGGGYREGTEQATQLNLFANADNLRDAQYEMWGYKTS